MDFLTQKPKESILGELRCATAERQALEPKLEFDLSTKSHLSTKVFHPGQGRTFDFSNYGDKITFKLEKFYSYFFRIGE